MIEYKSDGLVVFVTSVGGGGSGEGGGSGGQMHPASLEKLVTREDELEAENARLREALKPFSELFYYPDDFGEYTSKSVREDEDWNEEANDEETSDYFIKRLWIKKARAALKEKE